MKKKYYLYILCCLTLVGSLFTVLASNMLFDDLFNKGVPLANATLLVSLPAVSVAVMFVLGILYVIRTYRHRECKKRISKTYLIIALVFTSIGFLSSILSGVLLYGTFIGAHPFRGYLIIFMILNLLLLGSSIYGLMLVSKWEEDKERVHINFGYVMKTIGWVLFIGFILNKLGLFLSFPSYVYWRNFYATFPVYLHLLIPLALGILLVLYDFGYIDAKKLRLGAFITCGCNLLLFIYTVIMGLNSTAFISSISQLMPISRMASMPIEIIIHFLTYTGVSIALLVISKEKKKA